MTTLTQKQKLHNAFAKGQELTVKQISTRFKIASPSKVISMLRTEDNLPLVAKTVKGANGRPVHKYSLSTSKARRVAAVA